MIALLEWEKVVHQRAQCLMQQQKQLHASKSYRYINITLSEFYDANRSPIHDYQQRPVLPLPQATEEIISLLPHVEDYVIRAKQHFKQDYQILTLDESAAIYLYSMSVPFYSHLNTAFRAENRAALEPWFSFLKLLTTALEKLPSLEGVFWRGVLGDDKSIIVQNVETWWSVNSCSTSLDVVEQRLGETGIVFAIKAIHGKDISEYSAFPEEKEVVLKPLTRLRNMSQACIVKNSFFIVHLEEEQPESVPKTQGLVCQEDAISLISNGDAVI